MVLRLPLPAMQLLLSSDQLRVPSEDTVLFTARRYVQARTQADAKVEAKAALAPLVRAPHLSQFALSIVAPPAGNCKQLLSSYELELRKLQQLQRIACSQEVADEVQRWGGVPASWHLPRRVLKPHWGGVRLEWRLPVERLKQACRDSFTQQDEVWLHCRGSPPLGGVAWRLWLICEQEDGGTVAVVDAGPVGRDVTGGSYCKFRVTVKAHGVQRTYSSLCKTHGWTSGGDNHFELQPMAGGWDEAVWAAAGLPATGEMLLQLHVHSVE